ncbi:helix-turn-helix transcriptional regulator [Dyadobacter sp. OTU695]|uniref:helix-turn-helix transcriptional regulator n=1 Tax=Dyadobacter sp. OTU695 TaxID=3043860 RepID=UPI00313EABD6
MKDENEILPEHLWNEKRFEGLREFVIAESGKQSPEQQLEYQMLGLRFKIEHYIHDLLIDEGDGATDYHTIHDFVKMYLKLLGVTQKQLAELFEMKDSNLHKYLTGERRLSTDMAFKLASFTKTTPEHWLRLEVRNELKKLGVAKAAEFEKYGHQNLATAQE